ncbi:MAG: zinc-binding dehydrogenase [Candidatus Velthaea sp.]
MSGTSRAAVAVAAKQTEIRELPLPDITPDGGLLRVLAAGICGSDIPAYQDESRGARILGHENVGVIAKLGDLARERWAVREGDLVALEEYLPCGFCADCRAGEYRSCLQTDHTRAGSLRYGTTGLDVWPSLWGGYSQYLHLHPRSVIHKVPAGVPPRTAAMALPLGNGFQWMHFDARVGPGQTVVVQGPGQQGLACVVAAKAAGAGLVIVSGLARDAHRLEVARRLGADHVVAVDRESLRDVVAHVTGGALADVVVDVSSGGADAVVNEALAVLRKRGTLVVAADKRKPVAFDLDALIRSQIVVRGVRGHSFAAVEIALRQMARRSVDLDAMSTHEFELGRVDHALRLVGGELPGDAIHVTVAPWN